MDLTRCTLTHKSVVWIHLFASHAKPASCLIVGLIQDGYAFTILNIPAKLLEESRDNLGGRMNKFPITLEVVESLLLLFLLWMQHVQQLRRLLCHIFELEFEELFLVVHRCVESDNVQPFLVFVCHDQFTNCVKEKFVFAALSRTRRHFRFQIFLELLKRLDISIATSPQVFTPLEFRCFPSNLVEFRVLRLDFRAQLAFFVKPAVVEVVVVLVLASGSELLPARPAPVVFALTTDHMQAAVSLVDLPLNHDPAIHIRACRRVHHNINLSLHIGGGSLLPIDSVRARNGLMRG
mmetsp:Transcript_37567/g.69252  ORF Transcript_37567/g.69252 Transcript_37567/m.69252 type:complete len:293 (+) Transcript_37567:352-1230(+)|eukprot:CAMPEP_0170176376 /NCGR_PEP_ID=MMETSP0040_2-20121228/9266_1 /TAXON_ID=641309 /ORGANISM="Lotharella oceanica, Strain CCMP622" /LENGTH=292 /DNA_ID=CAMNT_0010418671 /DNA_START=345 /DNA_END=1223 /DNA_ORIENTATION=+